MEEFKERDKAKNVASKNRKKRKSSKKELAAEQPPDDHWLSSKLKVQRHLTVSYR